MGFSAVSCPMKGPTPVRWGQAGGRDGGSDRACVHLARAFLAAAGRQGRRDVGAGALRHVPTVTHPEKLPLLLALMMCRASQAFQMCSASQAFLW